MYKIKIILLLFFALSCKVSFAQENNTSINREFNLAVTFYQSDNLNEALGIFDKIINSPAYNSKVTPSFLFKGKILLKQKKYSEALSTLNQFLNIYPASRYVDEARMVIAKIYFEQNNFKEAFEQLNKIIASTKSPEYYQEAQSLGEKLALNYLSTDILEKFYDAADSPKLRPFLLFMIGKSYLYKGNIRESLNVLKQVSDKYPVTKESIEAQNLSDTIARNKSIASANALVGVILPLYSDDPRNQTMSPVKDILEGIKFAFSQYNRKNKDKIGLIIRDTRRNKKSIESIANEFEGIPGLNTVIGPVYSDEVLEAGNAFYNSNIKIISPTATDNGLTSVNKNVYQANPSFAVRGKTMADFVYFIDKRSKVAVISSNTGYSSSLALAFIEEFKKIGGQVLDYEIYPPNSIEITSQTNKLNLFRDKLEAIYAPISDNNDAPVILSSLVLDSLYVPMYGNQDWYGINGMETSTSLSSNFVLSSDYYIDFSDPAYNNFSKIFLAQTGRDANRNVLYGYDLAEYLLNILAQSNNDPDKIERLLNSDKTQKGFHNNFQFDEKRVNKYLNIIRYQNGSYILIDRFKAIN